MNDRPDLSLFAHETYMSKGEWKGNGKGPKDKGEGRNETYMYEQVRMERDWERAKGQRGREK